MPQQYPPEELELFDEDADEELPDALLDNHDSVTKPSEELKLAEEPLFAALLRQAVGKLWPGDIVMMDFVDQVVGPMSALLGTHAAKGGDFVAARLTEELPVEDRYRQDQSFRAHLINGLFPTLHIAHYLKTWGVPRLRRFDDQARRVFISGYVLHDWLKFPEVEQELQAAGLSHDTVNANQHLSVIETCFRRSCEQLGLNTFLQPIGGSEAVLHDLIYIASNTQVRWGTLRNLSALPRLALDGRTRDLCERLSTLADLITYVARTPREVPSHQGIRRVILELADNTTRLVYHHVAENRGIVTNLINNAALRTMQCETRIPLLYAPSGVVYLERNDAPPLPDVTTIVEETVAQVRETGAQRLQRTLTGFRRDGKGLKRADYYDLFFDLSTQVRLAALATFKNIPATKAASAGKRFAKMQAGEWLQSDADLELPDDIRVDQLAEWCYYTETLVNTSGVPVDVTSFLLEELGVSDVREFFDDVPRDNRAGGVGYHWYFAAGHYLKRHPHLDPAELQERIELLANGLATRLAEQQTDTSSDVKDAWRELRTYTQQVVTVGHTDTTEETDRASFAAELAQYHTAKKTGRGRTAVCSLCSSPFAARKQQEAALLFSPQVYSNKMPLHGATAIRDICPICGLEMMLRQVLMNRTNATGGRFEGRNIRYLAFYPTYFFSPETLEVFRTIHNRIQRISFTELRRQLVVAGTNNEPPRLRVDATTLQQLEPLLLSAEDLTDTDEDRYARMHFPQGDPVTFYFLGIPPAGRDAKDAESWIHPTFLALLMPICVDVKVVASASPLPLLLDAHDMDDTVFLDGAHAFVRYLVEQECLNVDQVLPALQRLIVGYLIHVDANSRQARGQWDYRWSDIPPLARNLATDAAYACSYLKKWQRKAGTEFLPVSKVQQYLTYIDYLSKGEDTMGHARELVALSRQFYRAKGYRSNNILRPLSVAAKAVLSIDPRLFETQEDVTEVVRGELDAFMKRVQHDAHGLPSPRETEETPQEAAQRREAYRQRFAEYFVSTVFYQALRGDVAALRGKQLNLLKNAYEVCYLDAVRRDRQAGKATDEEVEDIEEDGASQD